MHTISQSDVLESLKMDNPWWFSSEPIRFSHFPRRHYFKKFYDLVTQRKYNRAVILMGPRRVGKTVMLFHTIHELILAGQGPNRLLYISLDTPTYADLTLEEILKLFVQTHQHATGSELILFFDEIQYHKDWEVHLKSLVDRYPHCRFVASGSATAALQLKSMESGAGRFSDFMLPPLTFAEYLAFKGLEERLIVPDPPHHKGDHVIDVSTLNKSFVEYINYGAFPEIALGDHQGKDQDRYLRSDIIDKVLQKDLPQLYGIDDIRDLNRLFTVLAYNTGKEVKKKDFSQTEKKYLEYLEAAFLIARIDRIDHKASHFERQANFKVYLTNPSIRSALFRSVRNEDRILMGQLAETAIFSQWFHAPQFNRIRYARWDKPKGGEIDIVGLDESYQKPLWIYDVKWSDRHVEKLRDLKSLIYFAKNNNVEHVAVTTLTKMGEQHIDNVKIKYFPCSLHCYQIGKRIL